MTDLTTRIADVKKKAETLCGDNARTETWLAEEQLWKRGLGYNQAVYIAAASPDLFLAMEAEIARLRDERDKARKELNKLILLNKHLAIFKRD